jgi:hypothetical protein
MLSYYDTLHYTIYVGILLTLRMSVRTVPQYRSIDMAPTYSTTTCIILLMWHVSSSSCVSGPCLSIYGTNVYMYPSPHMTYILLLMRVRTVPQYLRHKRIHPDEMYPPPHDMYPPPQDSATVSTAPMCSPSWRWTPRSPGRAIACNAIIIWHTIIYYIILIYDIIVLSP